MSVASPWTADENGEIPFFLRIPLIRIRDPSLRTVFYPVMSALIRTGLIMATRTAVK
jgi:hypothetical protein